MALTFIEPVAVPEVYFDGIAYIDHVGPIMKLALYSLQKPTGSEPHTFDGVIVMRLAILSDKVHANAMMVMVASETQTGLDQVN